MHIWISGVDYVKCEWMVGLWVVGYKLELAPLDVLEGDLLPLLEVIECVVM